MRALNRALIIFLIIFCVAVGVILFTTRPLVVFLHSTDPSALEPVNVKVHIFLYEFARSSALILSFISFGLFLKYRQGRKHPVFTKKQEIISLLLIFITGTIIRLLLAYAFYGNYDMESYSIVSNIALKGGNVYAETFRYNYSPVWFTILTLIRKIYLYVPLLSFNFLVKFFISVVDIFTLLFIVLISRQEKLPVIPPALFFYLNPVSFLITGFHGQFENLAILMIMIGIYGYVKLKDKPLWGKIVLWISATLGMIVKHNIFYELIICLNYAIKRHWIKILLFIISVGLFLFSFIPYWSKAGISILSNVFGYPSHVGYYGITSLIRYPPLKYLFILGLFIFPFFIKSRDLIKQCLLGMLFFLTFTTGIAIQYFVLPIGFGALRYSRGFLLYSLLASMYILGSPENLNVPIFNLLNWNIVWIGVLYWFFYESRASLTH